jgi:hypothetical protein
VSSDGDTRQVTLDMDEMLVASEAYDAIVAQIAAEAAAVEAQKQADADAAEAKIKAVRLLCFDHCSN